jgi:sugar-specific transcriptional regulator TrmB
MNLIEAVKNWGLNDKEAQVYLALLQLGLTTAYNVANKSGLKKPTTYVILEQLREKGMVKKIPRAKKLLFEAETPEHIWQIVDERMLWAKRALPELLAVRKEKSQKVSVAYYEGIRGFREIYYKLVKEVGRKEEILGFYAHLKDSSPELIDFWAELNTFQEKNGTRRRVITTANDYYKNNETIFKMLQDQRIKMKELFQEKYDSNISIEIYGEKVLISSHRYLQAVVMDNTDVAIVLRQIFELVWDLVEKDRKSYIGYSNVQK